MIKMPVLIADCPRCGAREMTFDVTAHVFRGQEYSWQNWHEVFSICRRCKTSTIFLISLKTLDGIAGEISARPDKIMGYKDALNQIFYVKRPVGLGDVASTEPPAHLPKDIEAAFKEGATCHAIGCFNAAACMFRLCLDLVSRPLLPDPADTNVPQPNKHQRHNLAPRLTWLFDNKLLPSDLRNLATCVKDDGNDGAHEGKLTEADADDLLDFTKAFLERLITEPKKIELAEARRKARQSAKPQASP